MNLMLYNNSPHKLLIVYVKKHLFFKKYVFNSNLFKESGDGVFIDYTQ